MKSPFTGKEMELRSEVRTGEFRKEKLDYLHHFYICGDTKEVFTNRELDELNQTHLRNAYRSEKGIPFTEEIKEIRERYNLNLTDISEILGLGANSYREYEKGAVPAEVQGNLISLIQNPIFFKQLVEKNHDLSIVKKDKLLARLDKMIVEDRILRSHELIESDWLNKGNERSYFTGFRRFSFDRVKNVIQFFASRNEVYQTKMNKLLFYADFLHFKRHGLSITGIRYQAIQRGPVPICYRTLYGELQNDPDRVILEDRDFGDYWGSYFKCISEMDLEENLTNTEIQILQLVADRFKTTATHDIVDISHKEVAWINNIELKSKINYLESHSLEAF
jgi:uncharacterized phage-associated protein/DNA-binding transcriptional regulator YiaG